MIWFTSDTHFSHNNVIHYCNRPFKDKIEMNKVLIDNWNSMIGKDDTVYHLGDAFFCGIEEARWIMAQLRGRKILIIGNHDKKPSKMLEFGFEEVHRKLELILGDEHLKLCHYPYFDPADPSAAKHPDSRFVDDGGWLLHGHVHCYYKVKGKQINVGVDQWNYCPISERTLLQYIQELKNGQTF